VDIHEDFTREARGAVHRLGLREAHFETRDASRLDWVKTPYDAIAVTGSMPELEPGFLHALSVGGRLFTVLGTAPAMEAMLITRTAEDDWARESLFETVIPPLVNAYNPPRFAF
jgi:protein-L-isoaspartate(D-aspartate) O-methyltransferase